MEVKVLKECGYEESAIGFALSYNSTPERAKQIFPKFAFGVPGEGKFLESIVLWLDVNAPRFWWCESDTYRVGNTKQSQSTIHTITKKKLTNRDFEYPLERDYLEEINNAINWYNDPNNDKSDKLEYFLYIKNILPEGFLQRRIWVLNYKTLQNIYNQRKNHKLPQWRKFLEDVLSQIEHPEFIVQK